MKPSARAILVALKAGPLSTAGLARAIGVTTRAVELARVELLADGLVERSGEGRETKYSVTAKGATTPDLTPDAATARPPIRTPEHPRFEPPMTPDLTPDLGGLGGQQSICLNNEKIAASAAVSNPPRTPNEHPRATPEQIGGALARVAALELEVVRLSSLVVKLQGAFQGLLAQGKRLGAATGSVSSELRRDVETAVAEALRQALESGERPKVETRWRVALYNRLVAAALSGDRFELDAYLVAKKARDTAPERALEEEGWRENELRDSEARSAEIVRRVNQDWSRLPSKASA